MIRVLVPLFLAAAATLGCAESEPPEPADPQALERLLVRLDAAPETLTPAARDKLARAERLAAPLEKLEADKIDPSVAEALIAR